MEVDGTSKLDLTTQSKDLLLEVSGASQVNAQGSSEYVNVEVNGVSKVDASNLVVEKAELEASGASSISVHAKEILSSMSDGISSIRNIQ